MTSLQNFNLPTSRDENWKYANLRPLAKVQFEAASQAPSIEASALPQSIPGYARYTFVDGLFVPELSAVIAPTGIVFETARSATPADLQSDDLRFARLNEANACDSARIAVEPGTRCATGLELVFVASADAQNAASYPRVELRLGEGAQLRLIERHVSAHSDANFSNSAVDVQISRGACVDHYRTQQAGVRATWIDTLSATLAEGASYHIYALNLGAQSARSTLHVRLLGRDAEFNLHAVSVADRQQVQDIYSLVEHAVANTRSRQTFRGIAAGRSRVACNSKVIVREGAHGADSYQSLRGLLAGTEAEIDVRPQLEIYTDDVRCAHGATAGKLDDNMLFYLLSRGLEPDTAQQLLKWAFLEDVVARIEVAELRRQIEQTLAGHMNVAVLPAQLP